MRNESEYFKNFVVRDWLNNLDLEVGPDGTGPTCETGDDFKVYAVSAKKPFPLSELWGGFLKEFEKSKPLKAKKIYFRERPMLTDYGDMYTITTRFFISES